MSAKKYLICNTDIKKWRKFCSNKCYRTTLKNRPLWNKGLPKELQPRFGKTCSEEMKLKISNSEKWRISKNKGRTFIEIYGEEKGRSLAKKHSEVLKKNGSVRGEKNPMWKGGLSYIEYPIEFDDILKEKIRLRDNNFCKICYKPTKEERKNLSVHHIDYNKSNNSESNLISLCSSCHSKTHGDRVFWKEFLMEKVNV